MCFQAQNASGPVSGSHGSGEGTGSCHIDIKSRPFSRARRLTAFEILSTTTLGKNHRIYIYIYFKITPTSGKTPCTQSPASEMYKTLLFFSDHKIDTDLQISKTLHNTFSSLSRHLSVTNIRAFIFFFLENPFLIKKRIRGRGVVYQIRMALPKP